MFFSKALPLAGSSKRSIGSLALLLRAVLLAGELPSVPLRSCGTRRMTLQRGTRESSMSCLLASSRKMTIAQSDAAASAREAILITRPESYCAMSMFHETKSRAAKAPEQTLSTGCTSAGETLGINDAIVAMANAAAVRGTIVLMRSRRGQTRRKAASAAATMMQRSSRRIVELDTPIAVPSGLTKRSQSQFQKRPYPSQIGQSLKSLSSRLALRCVFIPAPPCSVYGTRVRCGAPGVWKERLTPLV